MKELSASEKNRQPNILRETPFAIRKDIHSSIKRKIAEAAVSTIKDGETIIIDGGSTTYQMVEFLASLELTIITNSFIVAEYLVKKGKSQIILPEGIIYPESLLILNPLQPDPFSNYHASKVFMGVEGINNDIIMNSRIELIQMEKSMINHADELVILADSSKFRSKGNLFLCNLDQVHTIITDDDISQEEAEQVRSKGIHLTTVPSIK